MLSILILTGSLAFSYCSGNAGMYYQDKNIIAMCIPEGTLAYDSTLRHEYGHYVYFKLLTPEQRQQYQVMWERDKPYPDRFLRSYSQVNVYEGFADDYAILKSKTYKPKNNQFKMRISLIKKLIKTVE